jgi:hypothetical protein
MSNVKLMNSGYSIALGKSKDDDSQLDVKIMALCPGKYQDMNGTEVEVTPGTIHDICRTYNESLQVRFEEDQKLTPDIVKLGIEAFDNRLAPNQLDHDDSTVLKTVGHVIGFMQVNEVDDIPYLFLTVRVKGKKNVEPVKDQRWRNVSIQYHPKTFEFAEISWVVKGAAVEARALSKPQTNKQAINNHLSSVFLSDFATIQQTEQILLAKQRALENELVIKKHLIALCIDGKINRATADYIEHEIKSKKIANPEVIKLMEAVLPDNKFRPKYLNLLNEEEMIKMSKENIALGTHDFIAECVALKKESGKKFSEETKEESKEEKNEKYGKSHAMKHKELMSKMAESYEKGDVEMGKKYLEKAHKLADDAVDGTMNLAEYDIDKKSEDSEEVKKLSQELDETKIKLAALKDEQTTALNKFKDEQMLVLGQFTDKLSENFNSSDLKQLLAKIATKEEVK